MSKKLAATVIAIALIQLAPGFACTAAGQGTTFEWSATEKVPPSTPDAIGTGNINAVLFNWMWYLGMIRGVEEKDSVATFELWKSTGTMLLDGQPCKLKNYRADINYQVGGMRVRYTCTLANGQSRNGIQVVNGQFAWDEDVLGAALVPGKGTATPRLDARDERLIRLWASPWGAPKAAVAARPKTTVALEGGKPVLSFPLPDVPNAIAKATLNAENQTERVEVHQGNTVTEFVYENYGDWNPADDKVLGYTPKHIVERRNGTVVLDITEGETEVGNLYVVMPVPANVRASAATRR